MIGIEHIAVQTDDYASAIAKLRSNGAHVMLEQDNNGRHVAFIEAPDGAQMEADREGVAGAAGTLPSRACRIASDPDSDASASGMDRVESRPAPG